MERPAELMLTNEPGVRVFTLRIDEVAMTTVELSDFDRAVISQPSSGKIEYDLIGLQILVRNIERQHENGTLGWRPQWRL